MLTAEHVRARVRAGALHLQRLDDAGRARAVAIAEALIAGAAAAVGGSREELEAALRDAPAEARDAKLAAGLAKLVLDRCEVDGEAGEDAPELRRRLFTRAAAARREVAPGEAFDRARVIAEVAAERGISPEELEERLYADLKAAQRVRGFAPIAPAALVEAWERAQVQAVLLKAARVTFDVEPGGPAAARALFRALKWNRLLFTVAAMDAGRYRVVVDGPLSLFDSITKYGLQLALALPAFESCASYTLSAELRWGKDRRPLTFAAEGGRGEAAAEAGLVDEAAALVTALGRAGGGWTAAVADVVLDLPGVGVCVPDLVLEKDGARAFVEVLGFWSRDAVFRRVELVEQGLAAPIVFCASSRLRVSEEVLPEDGPAALLVYKGAISARALLEKVEAVAARAKVTSSRAPRASRASSSRRGP